MACFLRMTVRRSLGQTFMASRPFGRREMGQGGVSKERGKGSWVAVNLRVSGRDYFDFRGQLADAQRFLRRYEGCWAR
jgi:hypothetical protein